MSIIVSINSFVNGIVWGPYMLALLVGTGIFLTVRSGFMQFRHFGTIFKNTVGILHTPEAHKKNEFGVSPFQAVMTALASTVGTGNITGVATAIALGGPVKQGFWGAFEVFFDTLVICTLTSLVIVSSGLYNNGMQGADLTIAAFGKAIGPFGTFGVTLATVLFAISTILGWSYYGEKSIEYLFKGKSYTEKLTKGYRAIFVLLAFVGAVSSLTLVWSIADTLNGLMAIPNLIGLLGLNGVIIRLVREFFKEKH